MTRLVKDAQVCQPLHHKVSHRDLFPSLSGSEEEQEGVRAALLVSLRSLLLAANDCQLAELWRSLLTSLSMEPAGPVLLAALEVRYPPFLIALNLQGVFRFPFLAAWDKPPYEFMQ